MYHLYTSTLEWLFCFTCNHWQGNFLAAILAILPVCLGSCLYLPTLLVTSSAEYFGLNGASSLWGCSLPAIFVMIKLINRTFWAFCWQANKKHVWATALIRLEEEDRSMYSSYWYTRMECRCYRVKSKANGLSNKIFNNLGHIMAALSMLPLETISYMYMYNVVWCWDLDYLTFHNYNQT